MKNLVASLCFVVALAHAQPLQPDMNVFAQRREAFMRKMEPNSVAMFPCKPEFVRNGDVDYEFRQESNFYYLSGFEEPESILLLNPAAAKYRYILFVRKNDLHGQTWTGERAGIEGAMKTFHADTAFVIDDFKSLVRSLMPTEGMLYYGFGISSKVDETVREIFLENSWSKQWPVNTPTIILSELRLIKNDGDLRMGMKKAVEISAKAHLEAMKSIEPEMNECEIQSVFEFVFRNNGSPRNGYPCIIGSGPNSCTLHYDKNTRTMKAGEVVLMDCAAEYGFYSADITRTVPVSGRFTHEQKEIYQLVLDAQNAAMRMAKPGLIMQKMSTTIDSVLGNGLLKLGFIKDKKDFAVFTLHGYSHWIGLEVHDVGSYTIGGKSRPLEAGMCFTIEPGIYVRPDVFEKLKKKNYSTEELTSIKKKIEPYLNIGVRIEDDILVTENGYINMSEAVPREIDAIEKLMEGRGIGNVIHKEWNTR